MSSWRYIEDPEYKELTSITRSLHLGQAMACYGKQRLMSLKIVSKTFDLYVKILWFAPTRPMNENNMYGNVSFTLDWKTALEQLGPYLYYVDQGDNGEYSFGGVLLTNQIYEFLTPVNDGGHGMPMLVSDNKHYVATASNGVQHVLEIGVEVDRNGENWLYNNCKIEANDHSSANTLLYEGGPYKPCICHRFNYFNEECPSPYSLQQTQVILKKRCPSMLRNKPTKASTRSRAKKRRKKVSNAAAAEKKQVSAAASTSKQVSAAAATRKQVAVVDDEGYGDYYDDYDAYFEERYPASNFYEIYHNPMPKKSSDEGKSLFRTLVEVSFVTLLGWYLWRSYQTKGNWRK